MDSSGLILLKPTLPVATLSDINSTLISRKIEESQDVEIDRFLEEEKKQVARDFESILLNKLFDEVQKTIDDWGFDEEGVSKQIKGIFWLYLACDVANKGGFGLYKEMYKFLTEKGQVHSTITSIDRNI